MNLKEQLAEKKAELMALKDGIEAGEPEAVKAANEIAEAIDAIQESIDEAAKAQQILAALNADEETETNPDETEADMPKGIGAFAVKSFEGRAHQGERVDLTADFKAATDVQKLPTTTGGLTTYYDPNIVLSKREKLDVLGLFGRETISGNALTYYVEGALQGNGPAVTAEGAAKPQVHFADPTAVTVSLQKIAAFIKETDELLEDMPRLASIIENRMVYLHDMARQNFALNNATYGLLATSGLQTKSVAANPTATTLADAIYESMVAVEAQTGFAADAVVMNPADYQILALGRDGEQRYYGGGYFAASETPRIWGVPVVVTSAIADNTFLVGNFRMGAAVVEKGGTRVELTNSDADDFQKNLVTLRVESRMALAVRYPAAFVKGTIAAS